MRRVSGEGGTDGLVVQVQGVDISLDAVYTWLDRFIIATALQNSMAIVTCDALIAQYQEIKVIW